MVLKESVDSEKLPWVGIERETYVDSTGMLVII